MSDRADESSLNPQQLSDLAILMSLNTPELMNEWIDAVGPDDVNYGLALLRTAALDMLDQMDMDPDAADIAAACLAKLVK